MTTSVIMSLIPHLPPDSPYLRRLGGDPKTYLTSDRYTEVEVLVDAMLDPRFAWKFVRSHVVTKKHLPPSLVETHHSPLWQAYFYEAENERNSCMVEVIDHPRHRQAAGMLKALLLYRPYNLATIAKLMQMQLGAVYLYDQLFFNVRDRRDDLKYITSLVYPEGKPVEWREDYMKYEALEMRLMRATYQDNINLFFYLLGYTTAQVRALTAITASAEVESKAYQESTMFAQAGGLHQANSPLLSRTFGLLNSIKQGGATEMPSDDSIFGLGGIARGNITMHRSVNETLAGCTPEEIERRSKMTPAERDADMERQEAEYQEQVKMCAAAQAA
jgi:hypothetical protein